MKYYILGLSFVVISATIHAAQFDVYKSPTCGCCGKWVEALEAAGHDVTIHHPDNLNQIKRQAGLPVELGSCHTAFVDGYVVEGHVPLDAIDRLLKEKPDVRGIAVPAMPAESLGMEYGREPQQYSVFQFTDDGRSMPIAEYIGTERLTE